MQRRRRRAAASHRQGQQAEDRGHDGAGAVDLRQSEPGRAERADSEGGDALSELVAGDHATGDRGGNGDQPFLPEADRQRQQR
jgi:hypothetical protein